MELKVLLCVFILLLLPYRDNGLDETEWYRESMTTIVVDRYNRAYKILNEDIIKPILEYDEKSRNGSNFDTLFKDEQNIDEGDDDNKSKEDESSGTKFTVEMVNGETTSTNDNESSQNEYRTEGEEDEFFEIMIKRKVDDDHNESDSNEFKFLNDEQLITTTEYVNTDEITEGTQIMDDADMNVTSTIQTDEEDVRLTDLVNKLRHGSNMLHELLKSASSGCEQLRTDLSTRIRNVAINISTQEAERQRLQSVIQGLVSAVNSAEQQVTFAKQVVREREATVENSERELRDAENRVEKARRCKGRRRRRFLGNWFEKYVEKPIVSTAKIVGATWDTHVQRPIIDTVENVGSNWDTLVERPVVHIVDNGIVKPVCSVVNMGGIRIAEDARNMARDELNAARNRLSIQQQLLSDKRAQLFNVQIQQNATNERHRMLGLIITQMQTNYKTISSLLEQFQIVNTHLTTVLGSSKTLQDEIKNLVDFELVIEPLKSLAEKMMKDQLMTSFSFEISARTIADVNRILDRLGDKLARLPFFIQDNTVTDHAFD